MPRCFGSYCCRFCWCLRQILQYSLRRKANFYSVLLQTCMCVTWSIFSMFSMFPTINLTGMSPLKAMAMEKTVTERTATAKFWIMAKLRPARRTTLLGAGKLSSPVRPTSKWTMMSIPKHTRPTDRILTNKIINQTTKWTINNRHTNQNIKVQPLNELHVWSKVLP